MLDNLQIGSLGWDYDHWAGGFYPEDMPEEWRLDYYANTFRVVLVEQACWSKWSEDDIEEVIDAVEGEFGFYFEVKDKTALSKLQLIKQQLTSLAIGVVLFSSSEFDSPDFDLQDFDGFSVTLVIDSTQGVDLKVSGKVSEELDAFIKSSWSWQNAGLEFCGEPLGVLEKIPEDPKEQRLLLESFMASLPQPYSGAPLFVVDQQVKIKQLQDLKTIGEFLGY